MAPKDLRSFLAAIEKSGDESLREHLRAAGLAHYKFPERLVSLDSLPTVGEKIDRRAVAARAALAGEPARGRR